jgi:hypothetical protein
MFGQVLSFEINILIWFLGCEIIPFMFPKSYSVILIKKNALILDPSYILIQLQFHVF